MTESMRAWSTYIIMIDKLNDMLYDTLTSLAIISSLPRNTMLYSVL